MEEIYYILNSYYEKRCKNLIFVNEVILSNNKSCKMYFLDTALESECNNYKKLFQEYLPFYVQNRDKMKYYEINKESCDEDISSKLISYGKKLWNEDALFATNDEKKLGIYSELFNDFYLNVVKEENILVTYSSKHAFSERNVRGIDVLGSKWENDNLTLIFSEAKFVESVYSASSSLVEDIEGTEEKKGHVSEEYINRYMSFVVDQDHSFLSKAGNRKNMERLIENINSKMFYGAKAINVFNELGINIRFVFFAIYSDNKFTPEERAVYYDRIVNSFNKEILDTKIDTYEIEVVFIPIKNDSTVIKEAMTEWD